VRDPERHLDLELTLDAHVVLAARDGPALDNVAGRITDAGGRGADPRAVR
jgi:hypothetical protein